MILIVCSFVILIVKPLPQKLSFIICHISGITPRPPPTYFQNNHDIPQNFHSTDGLKTKCIMTKLVLIGDIMATLHPESSQTNVILQYKLLASILSAVCSVIQQSQYVLHFYCTLYDAKYDCKITMHQTILQLHYFMLLNNHQYNCNID